MHSRRAVSPRCWASCGPWQIRLGANEDFMAGGARKKERHSRSCKKTTSARSYVGGSCDLCRPLGPRGQAYVVQHRLEVCGLWIDPLIDRNSQ